MGKPKAIPAHAVLPESTAQMRPKIKKLALKALTPAHGFIQIAWTGENIDEMKVNITQFSPPHLQGAALIMAGHQAPDLVDALFQAAAYFHAQTGNAAEPGEVVPDLIVPPVKEGDQR